MTLPRCCKSIFLLLLLLPILAAAALPPVEARVRYMALGDVSGAFAGLDGPPLIDAAFRAVSVH